ncbi:MAG: hypothetical protein JSS49_02090 [Planctomycetes bacterium]|nr:hypothetical protein [Planctomycetota bacterium]
MTRIVKSVPLLQPGFDGQGDFLSPGDLADLESRINSHFIPFRCGHSSATPPIGYFRNASIGLSEQGTQSVFADLVCHESHDVLPIGFTLQRSRRSATAHLKYPLSDVRFVISSNASTAMAEEIAADLNCWAPCQHARELLKAGEAIDLFTITVAGVTGILAGGALAGFAKKLGEKAGDEAADAIKRAWKRVSDYWKSDSRIDPANGASAAREFVIRMEAADTPVIIEFVISDRCDADELTAAVIRLERLLPVPTCILPDQIRDKAVCLTFEWESNHPGPGWFVSHVVTKDGHLYTDKRIKLADESMSAHDILVSIGATIS